MNRRHWIQNNGARVGAAAGALALGSLSGCATGCGVGLADGANREPSADDIIRPSRLALVLSSGGPRGFVHVGVLQALGELGIVPDFIVGSSVGALVGCMAAAQLPVAKMRELALDLGVTDLFRPNFGPGPMGSAAGVASWLCTRLQEAGNERGLIERLPTRFVAVTYNTATSQLTALGRGDAGTAVAASCSVQDRLAPVRIGGHDHVDADLFVPLPVRLAKSLGAQHVLAVDASAHERLAPPSAERFAAGDARKRALTQPDADAADLTLHPVFDYYVSWSKDFRERTMQAGYAHTLAQRPALDLLKAQIGA